jgi:hypothetical protein
MRGGGAVPGVQVETIQANQRQGAGESDQWEPSLERVMMMPGAG